MKTLTIGFILSSTVLALISLGLGPYPTAPMLNGKPIYSRP